MEEKKRKQEEARRRKEKNALKGQSMEVTDEIIDGERTLQNMTSSEAPEVSTEAQNPKRRKRFSFGKIPSFKIPSIEIPSIESVGMKRYNKFTSSDTNIFLFLSSFLYSSQRILEIFVFSFNQHSKHSKCK